MLEIILFLVTITLAQSSDISSEYPLTFEEELEAQRALFNPDLFEGDILGINKTEELNAIPLDSQRWPNAVVPYLIDSSLSDQRNLIQNAINEYNKHTCIRWKPRTNENDYVHMYRGNGCNSYVGRVGGRQILNLGTGCHFLGTVIHEMMHAMGFDHEHNRSDRDQYLIIYLQNVQPQFRFAFNKLAPNQNRLLSTFNYNSIMIYGEDAFSANGQPTMKAKQAGIRLTNPFSKPGFAPTDISALNKLYHC